MPAPTSMLACGCGRRTSRLACRHRELRAERLSGGGAGYAGYRYLAGVIRSIEPMIENYGVATADELDIDTLEDRLRTAAAASGSTVAFSAIVSAWTTKPAI